VSIIEQSIANYNELDSDYVVVCTGSNKKIGEDFHKTEHIPVNTAFVTQCYWDFPKFTHTLTVARPWGWVFGVPLQKRCAIGYLYNKNYANLDTVKSDVKNVFREYNLQPSDTTNYIEFENFWRKENFSNRIVYNGNASFFLEPLEATSTGTAINVNRVAWDVWQGKISVDYANSWYTKELSDIESMICLHYASGSIWQNEFWKFAQQKSLEKLDYEFYNRTNFAMFVLNSLLDQNRFNPSGNDVGTWHEESYYINIKNLGLESLIESYKHQYFL